MQPRQPRCLRLLRSALMLYNRRWLLRHGALVRWALGDADGRSFRFVGYRRAAGRPDALLRARRLHFAPRRVRDQPAGDRWPLTFWREHGFRLQGMGC